MTWFNNIKESPNDAIKTDDEVIEPSKQYRKGFDDCKRAYELEFAREAEQMRKQHAQDQVTIKIQEELLKDLRTSVSTERDISDLISRADVLGYIERVTNCGLGRNKSLQYIGKYIENMDSADRPTLKQTDTLIIADALRYLAQDTERHLSDRTRADALREQILAYGASMCAERVGEWIEKERHEDEDTHITEWQSARCSLCGKYLTTPFMYYFTDYPYCPSCGARMENTK